MGVLFPSIKYGSNAEVFSCAKCNTVITNRKQIISTNFIGETGQAFLFDKVGNVKHNPVEDVVLLTGRHMVRDVFCRRCTTKIGWFYESATVEDQRYKEGKTVLERALLKELDWKKELEAMDNVGIFDGSLHDFQAWALD